MKTSTLSMLALVGLAAIASPVQLAAQNLAMRVDIPFDFKVGTHPYAAGRYMVSGQADHAIQLRRADGKVSGLAVTQSVVSNERYSRPRLIFRHMGTGYFLSQVWGDSPVGRDLWVPKVKSPMIAKTEVEQVTLYAAAN